jgi:hypothetical protein
MRSLIVALAALAFATSAFAAKNCTSNSKPCGDTCISKSLTCHIAPPAAPHCNPAKSKPCGKVCIPLSKTRHIPS